MEVVSDSKRILRQFAEYRPRRRHSDHSKERPAASRTECGLALGSIIYGPSSRWPTQQQMWPWTSMLAWTDHPSEWGHTSNIDGYFLTDSMNGPRAISCAASMTKRGRYRKRLTHSNKSSQFQVKYSAFAKSASKFACTQHQDELTRDIRLVKGSMIKITQVAD
jgi:hypothetical protein